MTDGWPQDGELNDSLWPPLVGRERTCDRVLNLLRSGHRLVTLVGRGGVGKTRIAMEVLWRSDSDNDKPGVLVPLGLVTDAGLVVAEIASRLGVPTLPGGDALDSVVRVLGDDSVLLILDNFEHVVDAAADVARILEESRRVQIVVTSQAPLWVGHERVVEVAPLSLPAVEATAGELRDNPCVQLYCDRAGSVDSGFQFSPRNAASIAELCRRLEGLPLALELAATRAGSLPASEILARMDELHLDLLTNPRRDVVPRQVDLRSTIGWTFGLLQVDRQRLLRRLSAVVVPVDLDTAAALDGSSVTDAANRVAGLVDLRLLDLVAECPARYSMPWSVRMYGREQLRAAHEEDVVLSRLVTYQAQRAEQIVSAIDDGDAHRGYEAAADQEPALVHALELAVERGQVEQALRIVIALARHWTVRGYQPHHVVLVESAIALVSREDLETPLAVTAIAWATLLALPHRALPDRPLLAIRLRQAHDAAARIGDLSAELQVLAVGCLAAQYTGDFPLAAKSARQALTLLEADDHPRWRSRFEVWAGMVASVAGDDERAIGLGLAALARASRDRDPRTLLTASMMLRNLAVTHSELDGLVPSVEETLDLAHALGYARYESVLWPLAVTEAIERGEPGLAITRCVQALEFARTIGDPQTDVSALLATVVLLSTIGEHLAAATVQGCVATHLPDFAAAMLPRHRDLHRDAMRDISQAIGPDGLIRQMRKGARLTLTDGVREAMVRVRERQLVDSPATPLGLTSRQREVLRLVAAGLTNKEIAHQLNISAKTVTNHLTAVFELIGVRTRTEAAIWARDNAFTVGTPSSAVAGVGRPAPATPLGWGTQGAGST